MGGKTLVLGPLGLRRRLSGGLRRGGFAADGRRSAVRRTLRTQGHGGRRRRSDRRRGSRRPRFFCRLLFFPPVWLGRVAGAALRQIRLAVGSGGWGRLRVGLVGSSHDRVNHLRRKQVGGIGFALPGDPFHERSLLGPTLSRKLLAKLLQPGLQPENQRLRIPAGFRRRTGGACSVQIFRLNLMKLLKTLLGLKLCACPGHLRRQCLERVHQGIASGFSGFRPGRFLLHTAAPLLPFSECPALSQSP